MDSDKELFLTQNCFSQEVEESNFSMGCIIGEKGNDLESDPRTLSMKIWRKYYPRKKSRKDRQIHGKFQQVVEWILLGSLSNHDDDGNKPPHKFAYLTMKNSIFARFARAFFIFWHFEDVLFVSTTWNDLFCSCVDDVNMTNVPSAGSNLIPGYLKHIFQAEDGIRDVERSRGLGDVYKRQVGWVSGCHAGGREFDSSSIRPDQHSGS